jgi:glycerol-3-phosphate acyltransferase PlsY
MTILLFIFLLTLAYVLGSLCSAIIVSQLFALPDPRTQGSKNPGATNVLRLSGKKYAALVFLGDMLKGFLPVLLGHILGAGTTTLGFVCLAAVLGHVYPIFFSLKGGKGVATAIGALLGLNFMLGVLVIAAWLIAASFLHYASLASIIALFLAPMLSVVTIGNVSAFYPLLMITLLVVFKHRENIMRLTNGTETKIRFKKSLLEDITGDKAPVEQHPGSETIIP